MSKREAPQLGDDIVISELVEPTLRLRVEQVLAHDTAHDAWQVGVVVGDDALLRQQGIHPRTNATLWVKRRRSYAGVGQVMTPWALYDVNSTLAAEPTR